MFPLYHPLHLLQRKTHRPKPLITGIFPQAPPHKNPEAACSPRQTQDTEKAILSTSAPQTHSLLCRHNHLIQQLVSHLQHPYSKSPEIRHFLALIYLSLTSKLPSQRYYLFLTRAALPLCPSRYIGKLNSIDFKGISDSPLGIYLNFALLDKL